MANYETLKSAIQQVVKQNGNNEITGALLQQSLLTMINSLGSGYQFVGIATPTTNPGTPDQRVFYIANGSGVYTNFGGISVDGNDVYILYYDSAWHQIATGIASKEKLSELGTKVDALSYGYFYGYYPTASVLPSGEANGYAYVGASAPFAIYNFDGTSWTNSGATIENVSIADNEDIADVDGRLKFANRSTLNGMGYVILRRGDNLVTKMAQSNTIYEIRYDFDLDGATINVGANSVLYFVGGKLLNGSINGTNGQVINASNRVVFDGIAIGGTWSNNEVSTDWFAYANGEDATQLFASAVALLGEGVLYVGGRTYLVDRVSTKSNMFLRGAGVTSIIKQKDNASNYVCPIEVSRKDNVTIQNLCIDGNYANQTDKGKHGIYALNSKNTTIENVEIYNCADAIMLGYSDNPTTDVVISNCRMHDCFRNTLVLAHCERVYVNNCVFDGSNEFSALIDIEKHSDGDYIKEVAFSNCKMTRGANGQDIKILTNKHTGEFGSISFSNCNIKSSISIQRFEDVIFENCDIANIEIISGANIYINNCRNSIVEGQRGNVIFAYSEDGIKVNNLIVNGCTFAGNANMQCISLMGVNDAYINDCSFANSEKALAILYENANIFLSNSSMVSNTYGVHITATTYRNLWINGCHLDNDTNYYGLVAGQTHISLDGNGFDGGYPRIDKAYIRSLRIDNPINRSAAVNGQIYESLENNLLYYKSSTGSNVRLSESVLASPSDISGTPAYVGQRALNTAKGIWYNAFSLPDYSLAWYPERIISDGQPQIAPQFVGQEYFDRTNKKWYKASTGTASASDWILLNP